VKGLTTQGVHGTLSIEDAAKKLLEGTGLEVSTDSTGAILIAAPRVKASGASVEVEKTDLEEIIVTATKENLPARKIAGSVTVVPGAQLDLLGAQSFADYLTRVPGVVFNASILGLSTATIRGVSTTTGLDQGQGTTGYFINDVPLTDPNFAVSIPDIDTFDVNNVSVLKGPPITKNPSSPTRILRLPLEHCSTISCHPLLRRVRSASASYLRQATGTSSTIPGVGLLPPRRESVWSSIGIWPSGLSARHSTGLVGRPTTNSREHPVRT
jgi:hypothetical protein